MKYPHALLGFIAFLAAMIWTWSVIHEEPKIALEVHSGIQEKLTQLIIDTIKAKKPTASEINVERVWTEPINEHRVKAYFIYSFVEAPAEAGSEDPGQKIRSRIQGHGLLDEQDSDGTGQDRWKLSQVVTTQDAISFDDAIVVTGDAKQ